MFWNDLSFCSADACEFCVCCRATKKTIDAYDSGEIDSERMQSLNLLSAYFFLDLRTVFVQQNLDKARLFDFDVVHQRIIMSLCCILGTLLKQLREYWTLNLEKIFSDQLLFEKLDAFQLCHCFPARNFQRFYTQWRSFANDREICAFNADGTVTVLWKNASRKRKSVSLQNDENKQKEFILRIDERISSLNRTIRCL